MAASTCNDVGTEVVFSVPQGGQVIRTFDLTPSQPVDGKAVDWLWADAKDSTTHISSVRVRFSIESSAIEQDFERAILVVNLKQGASGNGVWRFAGNGVAINPEYRDIYHNVEFEVVNDGETLIAFIQVVGETQENIKFRFLAAFSDAVSGLVSTYESADPDIKIGRP